MRQTPFAMALINFIAQVPFEFGANGLLKQQGQRFGIRRPPIVMGRGVKAAGTTNTVLDAVGPTACRAGIVTLNHVTPPNPSAAAERETVGANQAGDGDGIVDVGSGSPIDLAKGEAVCATHHDPLPHFAVIEVGADRITSRAATVFAVPTPDGIGSDVGRGARAKSSAACPGRWTWAWAAEAALGPSVRTMTARPDLPTGLAPRGEPRAMFRDIVHGALKDHRHRTHPRIAAVTDGEAMLETNL
jgi:alcohol dehydrogenase class IV